MDESYFGGKRKGNRGRGAKNKIPVFGILERDGKVKCYVNKFLSLCFILSSMNLKNNLINSSLLSNSFKGR
jgi:transposase-like protein